MTPSRLSVVHSPAMTYIRDHYDVPAQIGGRVLFEGRPGTIMGTSDHYLRIKLDDEDHAGTFHATWHIKYVGPTDKENQDEHHR